MHGTGPAPAQSASVKVWDAPVRIFHWALAVLIFASWATYEFSEQISDEMMRWHRVSGYSILVLVVWRVLWGFAGSPSARFTGFVTDPAKALSYLGGVLSGSGQKYLGHNPAGGLFVLALLLLVLAQAFLGLFSVEDNDLMAGPLNRLVSEGTGEAATSWHRILFYYVLLPAIGLHIAANVFYTAVKKEPLIPAMITGSKPTGTYVDASYAVAMARPIVRASGCLVIAVIIVFAPLLASGGRLL